jgi:ribose/xylose/arabinose/galactoside ABC-type transport system permease subunit
MNTAVTPSGFNARRLMVLILAILGILSIIAGILYLAGTANSLHFMVGSTHKGHHAVRAAVSFVIGLALLAAAWFANRSSSR